MSECIDNHGNLEVRYTLDEYLFTPIQSHRALPQQVDLENVSG